MNNLGARSAVIYEARTWLRTPFRDNQRAKGAGCDCLGLIVGVYQNAGIVGAVQVPRYSAQHMLHRDEEIYIKNLLRYCGEVEQPLPGDIAVFLFGRTYSHAGIVIRWPNEMIHSYVGDGVTLVDPTRHAQLRKRYSTACFFSPWVEGGKIATPMLQRRLGGPMANVPEIQSSEVTV